MVLPILDSLVKCTLLRKKYDMKQCYNNDCWDDNKLIKYVKEIKIDCACLCETSEEAEKQFYKGSHGTYFDHILKDVKCDELFASPVLVNGIWPDNEGENIHRRSAIPLEKLPPAVLSEFTYGRRISPFHLFIDDTKFPVSSDQPWTISEIDYLRKLFRKGQLVGGYGNPEVMSIARHIDDHMSNHVNQGNVLVIGSLSPWLEAILLEKGANHVTTLEYTQIHSLHPNVTVINPHQLRNRFLDGTFDHYENMFDAVVSFSSIEHSGLGRYGDPINPWADIITMATAWCICKPGAVALIGLPVRFEGNYGIGSIAFNAGRLYGKIQLQHLFTNWEQVYTEAFEKYEEHARKKKKSQLDAFNYQPIFIVRK